jgi:hypothetical protein
MSFSKLVWVRCIVCRWNGAALLAGLLIFANTPAFTEPLPSAYGAAARHEYSDRAPRSSKWKALWKWSASALIAGSSIDAASSWGYAESNALLRSGGGQLAGRGTAIKLGVMGGALLGQYYLVKKKPELEMPLSITNFAIVAAYGGVALRNYRVR